MLWWEDVDIKQYIYISKGHLKVNKLKKWIILKRINKNKISIYISEDPKYFNVEVKNNDNGIWNNVCSNS